MNLSNTKMEEEIIEFQKSKRDRTILSDQELNQYLQNLGKYFKIKNTLLAKNQNLFIQKIKIEIASNGGFYLGKDGIYSSENIQILHFGIHRKYLDQLFQNLFLVDQIRSYLYYGLLNAIVETTKTFFEIEITFDEIYFHSNDSIEKTEFGMYFYLMSISNKYEKQLCVLELPKFQNVVDHALQIDKMMAYQDTPEEISEIQRYYNYMKIGLLNRNLYLFQLMFYVFQIFVKQNELFYHMNQQTLTIDPNLYNKIQKCLSSQKSFTLVPFTLELKNEDTTHQNIILIDHQQMMAERFEPHGSTREKQESSMNAKLGLFFARMGIEYIPTVCLKSEIQAFENFVPDFLKGKCVTLSMDYLKYRLDESLDREKASLVYYEDVNKKGVIHWKEISEQNDKIFNAMQIYLDILNQTFKTSLYFDGTLLAFSK